MKIAFANDHAAFEQREALLEHLRSQGHEVMDCGADTRESCHFPEFAAKACRAVIGGQADYAVLVCGTGIGMSIAANKFPGIRCALAHDVYDATMTRAHNNANAIALRGRFQPPVNNIAILDAFLSTDFEGGRHQMRMDMIAEFEKECGLQD